MHSPPASPMSHLFVPSAMESPTCRMRAMPVTPVRVGLPGRRRGRLVGCGHERRRILHIKGRVLAGPEDVRDELWVVDGQHHLRAPAGAAGHDPDVIDGLGAARAWWTRTATSGWTRTARSTTSTSEKQALTDRDAGTLLLRDAGSPSDTRWIDDRDGPAADHPGRPRTSPARSATSATTPTRSSPATWPRTCGARRGAATAGSSSSATGSTATRATSRPAGRAGRCEEAIAAAHEEGARVTAHCFAEDSLRDLVEAGIDCIEHATGLTEETIPLFAERGVAIVPTLVNIADVPAARGGRRGQVPALVRPHAAAARAPLRHRARRLRRGHPRLRRHGRGRFPRRTGWSPRRSASW